MNDGLKKFMQTMDYAEDAGHGQEGVVEVVRTAITGDEFELTPRELAIFNIGVSEGVSQLASRLHEEGYTVSTPDGEAVVWDGNPSVTYVAGLWRDVSN